MPQHEINHDHIALARALLGILRDNQIPPADAAHALQCALVMLAEMTPAPHVTIDNHIAALAQLYPAKRGPLVLAVLDRLADHVEVYGDRPLPP